MLILRRKAGESLLLGDDIKVTVLDAYEGGVRLAVEAPRSVTVLRSELLQAADANRDSAVTQNQASPQELLKLLKPEKAEKPPEG